MNRITIRQFLCALAFLFPLLSATAQDTDAIKAEINKVKKSSSYIYAESTAPLESDARQQAESQLYERVNEWAATQKKLRGSQSFVINNRKDLWSTLAMPRGTNMQRVFIYVKKSDIIAGDNAAVVANDNLSVVERVEDAPVPAVVAQIGQCKTFSEAETVIRDASEAGEVSHFGRFSTVDDPSSYYLFIYNRDYQALAILSPADSNGKRSNMRSGQEDGIENYRGCGAICFKTK